VTRAAHTVLATTQHSACAALLHTPALFFFFFNDTATTEIYTLSLHDALPISHIHTNTHTHTYIHTHTAPTRSEEHTSELQSHLNLVCRLLLENRNTHVCTPITLEYHIPSSACTHEHAHTETHTLTQSHTQPLTDAHMIFF